MLNETLAAYEAAYAALASAWPTRLEAIRAARLDLIAAHAGLGEYGRHLHQHAITDTDRANAKAVFSAAERVAAACPRTLDSIFPPPSPRDMQAATAKWRRRFEAEIARAAAPPEETAPPTAPAHAPRPSGTH